MIETIKLTGKLRGCGETRSKGYQARIHEPEDHKYEGFFVKMWHG